MSLVDYASSSGEEEEDDDVKEEATVPDEEKEAKMDDFDHSPSPTPPPPTARPPACQSQTNVRMISTQTTSAPSSSTPAIELPDASLLLASQSFPSQQPTGYDHASRVAAAMTASASRKRESNGTTFQLSQNKHPRGSSHSRNVAERPTSLLPPQLLGRSNVVTEDINKLFVNRHSGSS